MKISKCACLLPLAATLLMGVVAIATVLVLVAKPRTPVENFIAACGETAISSDCKSIEGIRQVYGFDLMAEIEVVYTKMQKTAQDIAQGRLSDEAYAACLKSGACAPVPMLGKNDDPGSAQGKSVSRTFWHLADGRRLTPDLCMAIPLCAAGLKSGAVSAVKNRVRPSRAKQSQP